MEGFNYLDDLEELRAMLPSPEQWHQIIKRSDVDELKEVLSSYRYTFKELACSVIGLCTILEEKK